jgi:hypothetical protein
MTRIAARKHARRFFGTMGATMRCTSRWTEPRGRARADVVIRRALGSSDSCTELARDLMAR